jgi:hypothetical protein
MTKPILSLKVLALIQLFVGAAAAGLGVCFYGVSLGASIGLGAGLMLFNLVLLGWTWKRLIAKKSIALTVGIIVIKYAILLGSIYYLAREDWFSPLGAGLGIASFMLAALILAIISRESS